MAHRLGADDWKVKSEYTSADGLITLSADFGEEDYFIDARPGYSAACMKDVLAKARAGGLEAMDADECEPEILEDDTVRIYLALAVEPAPVKVCSSTVRRRVVGFALAACFMGALWAPSPAMNKDVPQYAATFGHIVSNITHPFGGSAHTRQSDVAPASYHVLSNKGELSDTEPR